MQTFRDIAPYVALGSAVLSLVLLVLVVVLMARVGRLRRAQTVVLGHHEQRDIVAHTEDLDSQVRNLREAVGSPHRPARRSEAPPRPRAHQPRDRALRRLPRRRRRAGASFALLDAYRSGVVFSAIAARDFARIYVKYLTEGVADRDLSPEEAQAMEAAVPRPLPAARKGREPSGRRCRRARRPRACDSTRRPATSAADPRRRPDRPRRRRQPRRSRPSATPWRPILTGARAAQTTRGRARRPRTISPGSRPPGGREAEARPAMTSSSPTTCSRASRMLDSALPPLPSAPPRTPCVV